MRAGRRPAAAVGIAVVVAALAAAPASARRPSAAGERTLVVGTRAEPRSLNPIAISASEAHQMASLIFLKLMQEQGDFMSFKPQLAKSWTTSDDGLDVTFNLRDDARWSDGEPVTADDVRFTWEVEVDTTVAWASASIKSKIRDVEVKDAHTVVFHFRQRYLYQLMDANDGVILPRHLLGSVPRAELKNAPFGRAPVGDGPYRLASWKPGQSIELDANPDYFGGKPRVTRVIFKFVPDAVTLVSQLRAGEIDLLESVQPGDIEAIHASRPHVVLHKFPSRRIAFVVWNMRRPPLDERDIRRALTMAIDRDEIIRTVWHGYARPCTSPFIPLQWAFDRDIQPIPFDRDAARAALASAGFTDHDGDGIVDRNGKPFHIDLVVDDAQNRVDVATLVRSDLRAVGVDVDVRVLEYATFQDRVLNTDFDGAFVEWKVNTKVDLTSMFHSRSFRPDGYNFASYGNPEVDSLIDEAKSIDDLERARSVWNRVQRLIYGDQPYTFIAVPQEITAIDDRFCNVHPNAISFFANLSDWGVAPDCSR